MLKIILRIQVQKVNHLYSWCIFVQYPSFCQKKFPNLVL